MGQFEGIQELDTSASSDCCLSKIERTMGKAPCQNCGKMVTVMLPFLGCVFCGDCMNLDSGQYDGTEDFHDPNRLATITLEVKDASRL